MPELILGLDIGTTSLKAAVYDCEGKQVALAVVEYSLLTPGNKFVELPCGVYLDSIKSCMELLSRDGAIDTRDISVIGFSVQGETLCFLGTDGKPLRNSIIWMDNRAGEQAQKLREQFGDAKCYEVTGQVSFEACWPVAKVMWLKENEPEVFGRIRKILLLEDYIIYMLTGRFVAECSLLTSTEYWDIRTKEYWGEMLEYVGIEPEWLPEVMESGELVGTILPEMAAMLGVSPAAKVSTGCLDQVAGAIGVGNITPGIFSENIGAALAICVPTAELTYDQSRLMPVHYFATPDTYMLHTFTTGGMCLRWFRDKFCQELLDEQAKTGTDAYDLMSRAVSEIAPGADGLLTLPHLQGSMAPDVNLNAKGVFYGATLQHTKAHFIRSIMESLGYIICRNLEAIEDMGLEVNQIRSMGGGSKSDVWNQIKADITGKPLNITYSAQDTACLGAAILAGCAAGIFSSIESAVAAMVRIKDTYEPDMQKHAMYREQYHKFKVLFTALEPLFALDA